MAKKGTPAYKIIPESMIESAVCNVVKTVRVRDVLVRVTPKCMDLLVEHYQDAEAAVRDYVPGSAEHRKAQKKAVAAMKSMNKYGDALHAWAEMLEENENESKEGKCLN